MRGNRQARVTAVARLAAAATLFVLATGVSGATAAGPGPYTLAAEALYSPATTELTLRVAGPALPAELDKVQVKAWPAGADDATTWNFRDVASPRGVATLALAGLGRGDRIEVRVHVKDGPQHNLEAETTVLRRPDLTVTHVVVPGDVTRTRAFDVSVRVAEVGGDVGSAARVELRDGETAIGTAPVELAAGATAVVALRVALARPGDHTLHAVVTDAATPEWDVAPNTLARGLYVNHYAQNGVVATDHPLATQVGVDVLRAGGNAFDAAAAVQFALNVVQPHLAGIGGGSNVLVRLENGDVFDIDARETAPAATTPMTYLGRTVGDVRPNGYAVGVPGTLRAVEYLLDSWGTTTLAEALDPAIGLAEDGFAIGNHLADDIAAQRGIFQPETREIFLDEFGSPLPRGATLKQPDLARTFRLLAREGVSSFYDGEIAAAIVAAQKRAVTPGREGLMTLGDLAGYTIDVRPPLSLDYRGFEVLGAGPSTNGGSVVLETLGLMREFLADPRNAGYPWGFGTRNSLHVFLEALRLSFADRDWWIGDGAVAKPLLDSGYLRARSDLIQGETVMCNPVAPGNPYVTGALAAAPAAGDADETSHTTHFSIIDRRGNAVVMTSTLSHSFGTGITVPGYGILLNDSLQLFNLPAPRRNDATGNPGANDAGGGKRPMGSMAPTLILRDDEPFAGLGSYSAAFIPSVVLNVVLNLIEYGLPLQSAVDAPRIWSQFSTGAAAVNVGFASLIDPLRAMGHVGTAFGGCADNVSRTPGLPSAIGSTGSFGVDLSDFGLVGGEDSIRFPDATTTVVERP